MDRGRSDAYSSGPSRSRLGQEPYDRGRNRTCFSCYKEGHLARDCPMRDNRPFFPGRGTGRLTGDCTWGYGQGYNPSWVQVSRNLTYEGREQGRLREGVREDAPYSTISARKEGEFVRKEWDAPGRKEGGESGVRKDVDAVRKKGDASASKEAEAVRKEVNFFSRKDSTAVRKAVAVSGRKEVESVTKEVASARVGVEGNAKEEDASAKIELDAARKAGHTSAGSRVESIKEEGAALVVEEVEAVTMEEDAFGRTEVEAFRSEMDTSVRKDVETFRQELDVSVKGEVKAAIIEEDDSVRKEVEDVGNGKCLELLIPQVSDGALVEKAVRGVPVEDFRRSPYVAKEYQEVMVKSKICKAPRSPCTHKEVVIDSLSSKQIGFGKAAEVKSHNHSTEKQTLADGNQSTSVKLRRKSKWESVKSSVQDAEKVKVASTAANDFGLSNPQTLDRETCTSGRASTDRGREKRQSDTGGSQSMHRHSGRETGHAERDGSGNVADFSQSGWSALGRHHEERDSDFDWRDSGMDSARDKVGNWRRLDTGASFNSSIPFKSRTLNREENMAHDWVQGFGSRDNSYDRAGVRGSDRLGYRNHDRGIGRWEMRDTSRRNFSNRNGGRNGFGNTTDSDFHRGEEVDFRCGEGRDRRGWVSDWRQRNWNEQGRSYNQDASHSDNYRGQYNVGQAADSTVARPSEVQSPISMTISPQQQQLETGGSQFAEEKQQEGRSGWYYNDQNGNLQGPVDLLQLKTWLENRELQSDYMVLHGGTNEWVTLEHAGSPAMICRSASPKINCIPVRANQRSHHSDSAVESKCEEHSRNYVLEKDACPCATVPAVEIVVEDLRIDERVEQLMKGIILVAGKEKELVFEALSSASRRVLQQDCEADLTTEESPRSHGGFASFGDQWKDGEFGSDGQGLDGFAFESHGSRAEAKAGGALRMAPELGMEVASAAVSINSVPGPGSFHAENKHELWKWPSRGGDWKLVYMMDCSPQVRNEAAGHVERGIPKKVVMNGGIPLCDSGRTLCCDPRRHFQDSSQGGAHDHNILDLPQFACKDSTVKVETGIEDYKLHSTVATPKGNHVLTPRSQVSTPLSQHMTPKGSTHSAIKPRSIAATGTKTSKQVKQLTVSQCQGPGAGSKASSQLMAPTSLPQGSRGNEGTHVEALTMSKLSMALVEKSDVMQWPRGKVGRLGPGAGQGLRFPDEPETGQRKGQNVLEAGFETSGVLTCTSPTHPSNLNQLKGDIQRTGNTFPINNTVASREDLMVDVGSWFYLDGSGLEKGPYAFLELQRRVLEGILPDSCSVYRKRDNIWLPISRLDVYRSMSATDVTGTFQENELERASNLSRVPQLQPTMHMWPSTHVYSTNKRSELPKSDSLISFEPQLSMSTFQAYQDSGLSFGKDGSGSNLVECKPTATNFGLQVERNRVAKSTMLLPSSYDDSYRFSPSEPLPPAVSLPTTSVTVLARAGKHEASQVVFQQLPSFHDVHPQFIGFTRGKLHEYVMKSYKAVFAGALDEGLEKWLLEKEQAKGALMGFTTRTSSPSPTGPGCLSMSPALGTSAMGINQELSSAVDNLSHQEIASDCQNILLHTAVDTQSQSTLAASKTPEPEVFDENSTLVEKMEKGEPRLQKRKAFLVEDDEAVKRRIRNSQRRRLLSPGYSDGEGANAHQDMQADRADALMASPIIDNPSKISEQFSFHLMDNVDRCDQDWALLKPSVLRNIYRCLQGDVKSVVCAMATCTLWRVAGDKYKIEMIHADLSSVHGQALDAVLNALKGFGSGRLTHIILKGCTSGHFRSLSNLLQACPQISSVDISGCERLEELIHNFPGVRWIGEHPCIPSSNGNQLHRHEDANLKIRSLRLLDDSGEIDRKAVAKEDGGKIQFLTDSRSKTKASDVLHCSLNTDVEPIPADFIEDSRIIQMRGPNDLIKRLKFNNGARLNTTGLVGGFLKKMKQEDGHRITCFHQGSKRQSETYQGVQRRKAPYRIPEPRIGTGRPAVERVSVSNFKTDVMPKGSSSSPVDGGVNLEKGITDCWRAIKEADTNQVFLGLANGVGFEGKEHLFAKQSVSVVVIDKRLKRGVYYGGKDGFQAFKQDVSSMLRTAFKTGRGSIAFEVAERLFLKVHRQFQILESQLFGVSPGEGATHSKMNKTVRRKLKNLSAAQHGPGKKRKFWEDDGTHKGRFGPLRKGRLGDWSAGDVDSDNSSEHVSRSLRQKKQGFWESECDSSEEEDIFDEDEVGEEEEEEETEASDSDIPSESEGEDGCYDGENEDTEDEHQYLFNDWGARMTKAAMVPPVTRKYIVVQDYKIVADKEQVERKMKVELPKDFSEKLRAAKEKRGEHYAHLDMPEVKDYKPRKRLGEEVVEQEVYGIDPYTHNLLLDTMPTDRPDFSESISQQFIEERLLWALNKDGSRFTGTGKAPMEYSLELVVERIAVEAERSNEWELQDFSQSLLRNMRNRPKDKFVAYRKGLGVVCNKRDGLEKDEFVVEFFGEVYPPWRWYEKQDGIRFLQKKDKDPTPEFYNIFYERPKGDAAGYDLLVVDAMHEANYASRLCHSCRPNCEAKITAVNGKYIIGVYTLRPIKLGEELTFDYNSVTESKEEYNNAVCLCGSQGCKGSYLNLTGSGTFEEVIVKHHGLLDRHHLLLESCATAPVTAQEREEMTQAGLGSCMLAGLPDWMLKYTARLVKFINFEKIHLPAELWRVTNSKQFKKYSEIHSEQDAEIQADGVYNQRLQNLAITLDKVRYILTRLHEEPRKAPPPLQRLKREDLVQWIWKKEDSVVNELVQCLSLSLSLETWTEFKQAINRHLPHDSGIDLRQCLLWVRDELRKLSATCVARHDAAADLIHLYAYTENFFTVQAYDSFESAPIIIHPLDLGSKHSGPGHRSWRKHYGKDHVWGQLINWYKQNVVDPGSNLARASRGCLILPDISSCYAKSAQHDFRLGYGPKHRARLISHMADRSQRKWPKSKSWSKSWCFKNERGLYGSPTLDAIIHGEPLNLHMIDWLKSRVDVFSGPWDEQ